MKLRTRLQKAASDLRVTQLVVEKDYALSYLLAAVARRASSERDAGLQGWNCALGREAGELASRDEILIGVAADQGRPSYLPSAISLSICALLLCNSLVFSSKLLSNQSFRASISSLACPSKGTSLSLKKLMYHQ
jgi:hypothetical protein